MSSVIYMLRHWADGWLPEEVYGGITGGTVTRCTNACEGPLTNAGCTGETSQEGK